MRVGPGCLSSVVPPRTTTSTGGEYIRNSKTIYSQEDLKEYLESIVHQKSLKVSHRYDHTNGEIPKIREGGGRWYHREDYKDE